MKCKFMKNLRVNLAYYSSVIVSSTLDFSVNSSMRVSVTAAAGTASKIPKNPNNLPITKNVTITITGCILLVMLARY